MTEARQLPADFGEWVCSWDLSEDDETPTEPRGGYAISGHPKDTNDIGVMWAWRPSEEVIEEERLKIGLAHQHHLDAYGEPDPRSDEEMWAAYREAIGGDE